MPGVSDPSSWRCRFAPSPTGYLHVGSAQSALFNWMFARRSGGTFLLRIEDTDLERNRPELTTNILDMLEWLSIDWSGEPVHQSTRRDDHVAAAMRLAELGRGYWCDCTAEAVAARAVPGAPPGYDGHCRERGLEAGPGRALRFRPPEGRTAWEDVIRGLVSFDNANIEDFVVLRSNGNPIFILANSVDDAAMGITHVIRGEDHVSNTPKYILLWEALGLGPLPTFAHLPLLVNAQRKKLSKRRDAVSVNDFKARGCLAGAMRNYLALLGWGPPGGEEIMPIEEMVEAFRMEDIKPSPAFFDLKKLEHINGVYLRELPTDEFVAEAASFLPPGEAPLQALRELAPHVQERVKWLEEVPEYVAFLWQDEVEILPEAWQKAMSDARAVPMLERLRDAFGDLDWATGAIEEAVRAAGAAAGYLSPAGEVQLAKAQAPLRVAVTGRTVGPPLWESLRALGRERTLQRIGSALARAAAER
jgi:glutamyl-tRNA synthetase